ATVDQQLIDRLRRNYSFPWVESRKQIRPISLHSSPPCSRTGLEHARAPRSNCELTARTYHPPKLADLRNHVWNEEDCKHTDDRVKRTVRKPECFHVTNAKLYILQPLRCGLRAGHAEQPFRQIDSYDVAVRPHFLRGRNGRSAATAPDVEHRRSSRDREPFDSPTPLTIPKAQRTVVEVVCCRVVRGCCFKLCGFHDLHRGFINSTRPLSALPQPNVRYWHV